MSARKKGRAPTLTLVFFFPGIDGDSVAQAHFRGALRQQIRFETVTYPDWRAMVGGGGGLDRLVDLACERIIRMPPDLSLRLAGYSFGAAVALALAARLVGQGRRVAWLAVFDNDLGQFTNPSAGGSWENVTTSQHLGLARRLGLVQRLQQMREAGWQASVLSLFSWLAIREGLKPLPLLQSFPQILPRSTEVRFNATLRRDVMASWLHRRKTGPLDTPIMLFRTDDHCDAASDLGWSAFAGPVAIHRVDGRHTTMFSPPHGTALAAHFARACLEPGDLGIVEPLRS